MPINAIVVGEDEEWIYYKAVLDFKITVGEDYKLLEKNGYREDIKYRLITKTNRFDEEFYTEEPLGSFYNGLYTVFRVWSPFATEAYVKIDNNLYSMTRKEKGVYELTEDMKANLSDFAAGYATEAEVKEIRDTLASLRLDSVISSGFRIGRSLASQYVTSGKAAIDGLPCEKPDKAVAEGSKISVRGLGKIKLVQINGRTKKDRISVVIHRYV